MSSEVRAASFPADGFGGWSLVRAAGFFVAVLSVGIFWTYGSGEEGVRAAVRGTGRTSMVFLCAAYVASATRTLWPSPQSAWLVRNRPYLGFSLGVSHAAHAGFLVVLFTSYATFHLLASVSALTGYVFLIAMLATSNAWGRRTLGPRGWKRLHTLGIHVLWFIFTYTVVTSLVAAPTFAKGVFVALGLGALALRIAGSRAAARGQPAG